MSEPVAEIEDVSLTHRVEKLEIEVEYLKELLKELVKVLDGTGEYKD